MAEIESKPLLLKSLKLLLAPKVGDGQALEVTKLFFIRMQHILKAMPECTYNPITAMGLWTMFTFQLGKTKR